MKTETKLDHIDITPTWQGLLPSILKALANAENPQVKEIMQDELLRMAKLADLYVQSTKG